MAEQKNSIRGKIMRTAATPEMVEKRAHELAAISGRGGNHVTAEDRVLAEKELVGDVSADDAADEPNMVGSGMGAPPTSRGSRTERHLPTDDEDEARMVQEGVDEAEHDEM